MPSAFDIHRLNPSSGIFLPAGAAHFDERRRSADERRPAARVVVVFGERAHERQIDMHVRIDESRKHILAGGIDDFGAARRRQVVADRGDRFAFAEDVGNVLVGCRGDLAVFDKKRHTNWPRELARDCMSNRRPSVIHRRDARAKLPEPASRLYR